MTEKKEDTDRKMIIVKRIKFWFMMQNPRTKRDMRRRAQNHQQERNMQNRNPTYLKGMPFLWSQVS